MLEPRAQHLLKTLIERYVERRPAGRLARAVAAFGARAVAGDDPQRDGGPGGDGLHREPAHVRRPRAHAEGLPLLRRQPDGGEAARADARSTASKASSSADRPQQLVSAAAGLLSQLTQFAGVVMTPQAARGGVPPPRIPAPGRAARAADPRHRRRRRAEPHPAHRPRVLAVAADRGDEFLQPAISPASRSRRSARASPTSCARCARTSRG